MKLKNNLKKLIALSLLSANFTFFSTTIGSKNLNNNFAYAYSYSNLYLNQDIEVIRDCYNVPLVHIPGSLFYVEKKLFDRNPKLYSKNNLNKIFKKAKRKAYNKLGSTYNDNVEVEIYIYDDDNIEEFGNILNSFFISNETYSDELPYIKIKRSHFFDKNCTSLTDEIMYAMHYLCQEKSNVIVDCYNVPLIQIPDTLFYVEKKLFDRNPELYSKDNLNKKLNEAKEKIYDKIGLAYNDDINVPIYIQEDNDGNEIFGKTTNATFCVSNTFGKIRIKPSRFFSSEYNSLAHEMIHALLFYYLGDNINLGIDEGLATQVNDLDSWGDIDELPERSVLLSNFYPSDREDRLKFYHSNQHIVLNWIKTEGKEVVPKFIRKVQRGVDSVKAFLSLGGKKVIKRLCLDVNRY